MGFVRSSYSWTLSLISAFGVLFCARFTCVAREFVTGFLVVVVVVVVVVVAAIFDIVLGGFNSKEHYGIGSFEPR